MIRLFAPGWIWRSAQALSLALAIQGLAFAAQAASSYTVQVSPNVDLGVVTSAASGDTVFRVDPSTGAVTSISGSATRSSSASTHAVVTISCTPAVTGDCAKNVTVALASAGAPSGRARALTRIAFTMGTAVLAGGPGPPGGSAASFTIAPIGPNSSKTFFVGADMGVAGDDSGLPTGLAEADFSVNMTEATTNVTSSATGRFLATIIRSIAISKLSDLVFGRVATPPTGSGTVVIDPSTGARSSSNGVATFASPVPSRAAFNVSGEGGQAFSVTVPASFVMSGPQSMTVTTSSSVTGTPLLSGSLGSAGSFTFGVGGSAPISSTTPNGDYSGSFTVTVAYN
ncbi:DUF4402 domain-containing protein [Phenylobacterium sp.]|uniref:DUF4402 domain-containing protein n=1 Tax=Phenylobacterium sp. TaxID=1871053 RepID=UPI0012243E8F|nr:DUF4402 domain-containing protein [Phenylobacterium sp.]THD65402.1 MAG: DUF4402 domain-containing protein [Phenylobacterium sp.]